MDLNAPLPFPDFLKSRWKHAAWAAHRDVIAAYDDDASLSGDRRGRAVLIALCDFADRVEEASIKTSMEYRETLGNEIAMIRGATEGLIGQYLDRIARMNAAADDLVRENQSLRVRAEQAEFRLRGLDK